MENELLYRDSISWERIPITIQDALRLCQNLGIAYLWVDSFCIVQDSAKEKHIEIAKMADIYQNAYITICASHSESATSGIKQHEPRGNPNHLFVPRQTFRLRTSERYSKDTYGLAWLVDTPDTPLGQPYIRTNGQPPLDQRGWAFQERLLSKRILQVTEDGFQFECSQTHLRLYATPSRRFYWTPLELSRDLVEFRELFASVAPQTQYSSWSSPTTMDFPRPLVLWMRLVNLYSRRKLSYDNDRITALSGIANILAGKMQSEYYAGLWQTDLAKQLQWRSVPESLKSQSPNYQGPTWSWVSVNGEVKYLTMSKSIFVDTVDIISTQTVLLDENAPFGAVSSAQLTLKGPAMFAECTIGATNLPKLLLPPSIIKHFDELFADVLSFEGIRGPKLGTADRFPVLLLQLGWVNDCNIFLVLMESSRNGFQWVRIGLYKLHSPESLLLEIMEVIIR